MRINGLGIAIFVWVHLSMTVTHGQESPRTASELLRTMAASRYEILQFAVAVDVDGTLPQVLKHLPETNLRSYTLDMEYSRIGLHFVTVAKAGPLQEYFVGRTNNLVFEGDSKTGILARAGETQNFGSRDCNELVLFDPRTVGLVDWSQLSRGESFESALSVLKQDGAPSSVLSTTQGQQVVVSQKLGVTLVVDQSRGCWPVRYEKLRSGGKSRDVWEVTIGSSNSKFLPSSATFHSEILEDEKIVTENQVKFRFNWKMVNGYVSTDTAGLQRLAIAHNVTLTGP